MKEMRFRFLFLCFLFTSLSTIAQLAEPADLYINSYVDLLKNKDVALVVNQTSMVNDKHLVDTLLSHDIKIKRIFAPEHGFRGTSDAGESVKNGIDTTTHLPIFSLYGENKKPTSKQMKNLDVVVFDIQDVGVRFYTYISTMHYVMEACAENDVEFIVLDRPNPNGHYIDGPVLDTNYRSFIGMHPIPVVHGLTVGELAKMINGEKWLKNGVQCKLKVIPCKNYVHRKSMEYTVKIPPSPNLRTKEAIWNYPSLCFFEPTVISIGRGTLDPFTVVGTPFDSTGHSFTPESSLGASNPKHEGKACYGFNLKNNPPPIYLDINLLIHYYKFHDEAKNGPFFTSESFFIKLSGTYDFLEMLKQKLPEPVIKSKWREGIEKYALMREKYLLYE